MPKPKQIMTKFLTVRLTPQERAAFSRKAESYGGPTYVMREMVHAFMENRLTITPPSTVKESLYHVPRNQD